MLYQLYFSTCLIANPAHCEMRVHVFDETVYTPQQCLMVAQPQMAAWQHHHGDRWRVTQFRCGKPPRSLGDRV